MTYFDKKGFVFVSKREQVRKKKKKSVLFDWRNEVRLLLLFPSNSERSECHFLCVGDWRTCKLQPPMEETTFDCV